MASVVKFDPFAETGDFLVAQRSRTLPASLADRREGSSLAAVVESEIIPRLMLAHGLAAPAPRLGGSATITLAQVDAFAPLTLRIGADVLVDHVERLIADGVSIEAVLVDLLAPAARQLGLWWEDDSCDFVEVTMGLWRLQEVVRELSARIPPPVHGGGIDTRRALFAAMPGEQHGFGTVVIGETFRCGGWDAEVAVGADMSELLDLVARYSFDIVGLTVSCDFHSERLSSVILALRSVSRNPRVRLMVGGRIFAEDPQRAAQVGADGTAADARDALIVADRLVRDAAVCG